ncbi:MAG TPA: cytochrome c1 [Pseudomonadales bacterium]|nr:cytochrome C [Gammaproteobacteria bacterium]MDP6025762.1 cytochrome c1 [Pseudomonadales bacterium]MDP6314877.1 cytochrome c1 [Pseudomonadales bacterium]MDP7313721.1 cytochrome c1 [Pseudomonadales bacterium]HJP51448.1 cytochrome c1 [Pseudomonadales bacterium]|tara:strand:+ start:451 stop:1104 length:654 start_codon:yes stop_codon:yes gene_type:complete
MINWRWAVVLSILVSATCLGAEPNLRKVNVDIQDTGAQKRGFKIYMEYCKGCHSAKFMRYERIATDLSIDPEEMRSQYINDSSSLHDSIRSTAPSDSLSKLFGAAPPDLSLWARYRGEDWLYSYLTGFYFDSERSFSYNNKVLHNVNMPWVLNYQQTHETPKIFGERIRDLTSFMVYMAEPIRSYRESMGQYVLLFLALLLIPVYLLKQSYWREISQ